jgi:hypothetical protein
MIGQMPQALLARSMLGYVLDYAEQARDRLFGVIKLTGDTHPTVWALRQLELDVEWSF